MTKRQRRADVDPPIVGELLEQLASSRGWANGLALARLRDGWAAVVGPILAPRCEPAQIDADGVLVVRCDHGATANEVTMLAAVILEKARGQVPSATITGVAANVRPSRR